MTLQLMEAKTRQTFKATPRSKTREPRSSSRSAPQLEKQQRRDSTKLKLPCQVLLVLHDRKIHDSTISLNSTFNATLDNSKQHCSLNYWLILQRKQLQNQIKT